MNRNLLLNLIVFPLFVIMITFVGILSISHNFTLSQIPHDAFDDSILSFDFLYFVPILTLLLIIILFSLLMLKEDIIKFRKKGDDKTV